LAAQARPDDGTVLVPAFSGLSAPYWDSGATAIFTGMTRTTGRKELVRAAEESIAFQITDVIRAMEADAGVPITSLRVDGGPTRDEYLMQFQSDMLRFPVEVSEAEELSGIGAAWMAGLSAGIFSREVLFSGAPKRTYQPVMGVALRDSKYRRWQDAVVRSLSTSR
jgi:glycerol kinase